MYLSKSRIVVLLSLLPFLHVQAQDVFNHVQPANCFTEDLRVINQTQEILRRVHPSENNKETLEIKPKNSAIIKLFRTKGINLKPYLRENNLNIKRISDLTRVIAYAETLFRKD